MRMIRAVLFLLVIAVAGIVLYNYSAGYGWTLRPPSTSAVLDTERVRETGAELAGKAVESAKGAAERTEEAVGEAVGEAALTAKIKSKMALDDLVKARTIDVDTEGSLVTLTGTVRSKEERDRAVRLARETDGVTEVVDRLKVAP
jgi:osmotically-inducible protein OsmY